jgi:superoxide dismutase, Fe-Mn family
MKTIFFSLFILLTFSITMGQKHEFKALPYDYDALEPYIDAKTVEIHYDRHHRAYYNNFMNAARGTEMEKMSLEQIFANMSVYGDAVRNNAGGWYNHDLYWETMKPGGSNTPKGKLLEHINQAFGSVENLVNEMNDAAMKRFGSGWAWLIVTPDGKLKVTSTPNQDNPLMDVAEHRGHPVLGIDVWEHAYYLKYQNQRKAYVDAFWKLLNWDVVEKYYLTRIKH